MPPRVILTYSSWRRPKTDEIVVDLYRHEIARWGGVVHLPPTTFRLISALVAAPGYLPVSELIEHVHGDREDGGPDDPRNVFDMIVFRARPSLAQIGITIECGYGRGWRAVLSSVPAIERRAA